jgi:hypothetical protein
MSRLLTAAAHALHNMPLGTRFDVPALTDEQAMSVFTGKANVAAKCPLVTQWDIGLQPMLMATPSKSEFLSFRPLAAQPGG